MLKFEVYRLYDLIYVKLVRARYKHKDGLSISVLPETVDSETIRVRDMFGVISLKELSHRILKAQEKITKRYEKNLKYYELLDKLCKEHEYEFISEKRKKV